MSGSPIVDAGGRVAGVSHKASGNLLYAIKAGYVKAFVAGESGTACSPAAGLQPCLQDGARRVVEMAAAGDLLAMYELGSWLGNVNRIDSSLGLDIESLTEAARRRFPPAVFSLAVLFVRDSDDPDRHRRARP